MCVTRVAVKPELLDWAIDRAGLLEDRVAARFPRLDEWRAGKLEPTVRQLEEFAKATYTPFGFFFLDEPPEEDVPVQDFRTVGSRALGRPSANLLDTVYICQQRQDWYRQRAILVGDEPLQFVGSASTADDVVTTAAAIRSVLDLDQRPLTEARNSEDAIRVLFERCDEIGILVMLNGIVGNNTHRRLDPSEFRGFALADPYAPLLFVNGADTKAGQIFTLAHELAHLWLGESGISDVTPASTLPASAAIERWCNAVAAEVLVPLATFRQQLSPQTRRYEEMLRLARVFRVSTLVVLRRMRDIGHLSATEHRQAHEEEAARLREIMRIRKESGSGGNFYNTVIYRLSPRFASSVIASTYGGETTFTEAFHLLGCRSVETMQNLGYSLGALAAGDAASE